MDSMENLSFVLPAVTPDSDGAASMLAELGGMVIIHDPAGCMENYVVFDEPRWSDLHTMLYSSSLKQLDAILGNDEVLIADAVKTAETLHPAFIALVGTPVPAVTGMDLDGMAAEMEYRTGIPAFALSCSGFRPWFHGAGLALRALVKRFTEPAEPVPGTLNILGCTPADFSEEQKDALVRRMEQAGWRVRGTFCMDVTLEAVRHMAEAERNLVVSQSGLAAAKWMEKQFKTPYTVCCPLTAAQAAGVGRDTPAAGETGEKHPGRALVIGEPVFAKSLAEVLPYQVTDSISDAELESDILKKLEENWDAVFADPLCAPLIPEGVRFVAVPHRALSSYFYQPLTPSALAALTEKTL